MRNTACLAILFSVSLPSCDGLAQQESNIWRPLPHVDRRQVLTTAVSSSLVLGSHAERTLGADSSGFRSVASVESNPAIPVWPTWGGGRVVPVSLGNSPLQDPFLLLAHHKHWFDPRDFLRGPFKAVGKALGLPYIDVEGFSMHPHRGIDILTYVLDGSDGFMHKDSLGGSRTYRGGCAQWMRTGAGVLHEEFWETSPDRRTNIELFQLWVNLPAVQKFDEPVIAYVGQSTNNEWKEDALPLGVWTRDLGQTLDNALMSEDSEKTGLAKSRPPVSIMHATLEPGAHWEAPTPVGHSAVIYVREGAASFPGNNGMTTAKALQTATFENDGSSISVQNESNRNKLDLLLLMGQPLREPIALGGPVVMNTQLELQDAYRQLNDGTFLNRDLAIRQQTETMRLYRTSS